MRILPRATNASGKFESSAAAFSKWTAASELFCCAKQDLAELVFGCGIRGIQSQLSFKLRPRLLQRIRRVRLEQQRAPKR